MAIGGVNGALDFGPLASGVGGEGTGKVRATLRSHSTDITVPSQVRCHCACWHQ